MSATAQLERTLPQAAFIEFAGRAAAMTGGCAEEPERSENQDNDKDGGHGDLEILEERGGDAIRDAGEEFGRSNWLVWARWAAFSKEEPRISGRRTRRVTLRVEANSRGAMLEADSN